MPLTKKQQNDLTNQIFERYRNQCQEFEITPYSYQDVWITLDCVLKDKDLQFDLQRLLDSEDLAFNHDIGGMLKHMDREAGELPGWFLPKCCRNTDAYNIHLIDQAISKLKEARDLLRKARAGNAADYVARSMKSAEGARRHADGKRFRPALGRVIMP